METNPGFPLQTALTHPARPERKENPALRYLGFDQIQNARVYRFDMVTRGAPTLEYEVTVDMALFRTHRVGIQEGPTLCARKLAADLEKAAEGVHELTTEDMRAYSEACAATEARRIEARRGGGRRIKPPIPDSQFGWPGPRP